MLTIKNSLNTGWLDGYAANSANIGSITGFNSTAATYSNVAYDKQMSNVAGAGKADVEGIEGKLTAEIATAAVALAPAMNDDATTNAWNKQDGRYPAPAAIAANEAVAATTIPVFLNEVDTRYEVTKDFAVGQAEGAEWTGDEVFFFNVDNVYIKDETVEVGDSKIITGTYNVQVTLGENTRIYPLTLNYEYVATAIDGVTADGEGVALTAGGIVLPAGPYAVFNIAGAKVQAGVAQAGQTVTLPAGTYVVLSRGKGVKVMIK